MNLMNLPVNYQIYVAIIIIAIIVIVVVYTYKTRKSGFRSRGSRGSRESHSRGRRRKPVNNDTDGYSDDSDNETGSSVGAESSYDILHDEFCRGTMTLNRYEELMGSEGSTDDYIKLQQLYNERGERRCDITVNDYTHILN